MKLSLILLGLLAAYLGYYSAHTYKKLQVSKQLVAVAEPFENITDDTSTTLLVLGDSTAVGVGAASPGDSVPAQYATLLGATYVENKAVSGARTVDLEAQLQSAELDRYDHILIQIGANDIIRFQSAKKTGLLLKASLATLPPHDTLRILMAGDVGGTQFFPWFLNPFYHKLSLAYHDVFTTVVERADGVYVNLYEDPATDPFRQHPEKYLSADGLHPTSAGYQHWFEKVRDSQ